MIDNIRSILFGALIKELYTKYGLQKLTSASRTNLYIRELENGKISALGYEFCFFLGTNGMLPTLSDTIFADISFEAPSKELIDEFSKKLAAVNRKSKTKSDGVLIFFRKLSAELLSYALSRGIFVTSYFEHPVLEPLIRKTNDLANILINSSDIVESLNSFKHEFSGFLQGYTDIEYFAGKRFLDDNTQLFLLEIYSKLNGVTFSALALTERGMLIHLFGTKEFKSFCNTDTIRCKFSIGNNYMLLKTQSVKFYFNYIEGINKLQLFGKNKTLFFKAFDDFKPFSFTLIIE